MGRRGRERILENIARLRRAEKKTPSADIAEVREDLESQLGGTVPRSLSASVLGVSHTALNKWVEAGDIPVVISEGGRIEIPIPTLLELQEQVAAERRSGSRELHILEPIMIEARRRAERMRPSALVPGSGNGSDRHRAPELRSLAYHRAIAPRLRRPMIDEAQRKMRRWAEHGTVDPRYVGAWEEVFAMPIPQIRRAITADDERGRNLRQNSPLAGLLSEPERRRILAEV